MHCNIDIHFLGIHKGVMHYLHAITSCMCDVMSRISVLYAHSLLTKHAISFSSRGVILSVSQSVSHSVATISRSSLKTNR